MFKLCAPALIYLCFSIIQIILDMFKELYQEALFKLVTMIIVTLMLNILCEQNLEIVAWIIMLVYIFGVNVSNGTIDYKKDENSTDEEPPVSVVFVKNPPQGSSSPAYS